VWSLSRQSPSNAPGPSGDAAQRARRAVNQTRGLLALNRACYFSPERRRLRLERRPQASAGSALQLPGALDQRASVGHSCEWVEGKRAESLAEELLESLDLWSYRRANVAKAFRAKWDRRWRLRARSYMSRAS
jgi:hypothetical protein